MGSARCRFAQRSSDEIAGKGSLERDPRRACAVIHGRVGPVAPDTFEAANGGAHLAIATRIPIRAAGMRRVPVELSGAVFLLQRRYARCWLTPIVCIAAACSAAQRVAARCDLDRAMSIAMSISRRQLCRTY